MQLPYGFADDNSSHIIRDLSKDKLTQSAHYLAFNTGLREQTRREPLRVTYQLRGLDTLTDGKLPLHMIKTEFERFLFKNVPCQRGLNTLPLISRPHLLPIPFPRGFFTSEGRFRLSEKGLTQTIPSDKSKMPPLEFLNSLPSLTRTCNDSRYLPHVEQALECLKTLKPAVRAQLSKDYALEDDEIRSEVRERLENLSEGLRMLEGEEDDEEEGGH